MAEDTRRRRRWTAEEKLQILQEARHTDSTVSEVCRRHQVAIAQFYGWEKLARQGALEGLRNGKSGRKKPDRIAELEAEVQKLQAVIAELSTQVLELKRGRWP